ncbi:hypothetical protein [Helicovermis profundi]|uniref:Class IIb bacteriocin, lactobin A/cerein 7B family n=1 Tax=Helicovermis profundi TaxID=3065157 RepID=A0AAU9EIC7_9FIRM|nr:hypothetical protein HLPR_16440 [Clostridia bacterium S502]
MFQELNINEFYTVHGGFTNEQMVKGAVIAGGVLLIAFGIMIAGLSIYAALK